MAHNLSVSDAVRGTFALPPFFGEEFDRLQFNEGWQARNRVQARKLGQASIAAHPDINKEYDSLTTVIKATVNVMGTMKLLWMTGFGRARLEELRTCGQAALRDGFDSNPNPDPATYLGSELLLATRDAHHRGWLWARQLLQLSGLEQPNRDTAAEEYLLSSEQCAANDAQVLSDAALLAKLADEDFSALLDACDRVAAQVQAIKA